MPEIHRFSLVFRRCEFSSLTFSFSSITLSESYSEKKSCAAQTYRSKFALSKMCEYSALCDFVDCNCNHSKSTRPMQRKLGKLHAFLGRISYVWLAYWDSYIFCFHRLKFELIKYHTWLGTHIIPWLFSVDKNVFRQ